MTQATLSSSGQRVHTVLHNRERPDASGSRGVDGVRPEQQTLSLGGKKMSKMYMTRGACVLGAVIWLTACGKDPFMSQSGHPTAGLGFGGGAVEAVSGVISVIVTGQRAAACGISDCANNFSACVRINLATGAATIDHDSDAHPNDAFISSLCPSACPPVAPWGVSVGAVHLSPDCSGTGLDADFASCKDIPSNGTSDEFALHAGLNRDKILCRINEAAKGFTGEICKYSGIPGAPPVCVSQLCPAGSVPYGAAQFCCRAPGYVANFTDAFPDGENCAGGGDVCSVNGTAGGFCNCPEFGSVAVGGCHP